MGYAKCGSIFCFIGIGGVEFKRLSIVCFFYDQ